MKIKTQNIYLILIGVFMLNLISCQKESSDVTEEVWTTVEKRMTTWKERDKNGQLKIYHPNFRRWKNDTLQTKETFIGDWTFTDMQINDIQIEKREIQFFTEANLSVAHYKVKETLEWIGDDFQEDDFKRDNGQVWTEDYLVSDYYIKEGERWLYIGGVVK
ncbi:hypothetical protein [Winogradskyella alexanderae]|uniref:Nuclear transport factor 2 family protein n=1 Tax=Winogradskyella alexanderae TaxID=2877123 RepID=A0ABS7XV55_9FLAO|nr:hypothetical protein [Winogradskyella alexanderae]MCA0133910.1 hypothetical protein [Winogradskyella alexanderae]